MFQVYSDFSSKPHGLSPVQYSHVYINIGNCYDVVTHSFRPLRDGLYWFIFDTFADELGKVDYSMRELSKDPIVTSMYAEGFFKNAFSRSDLRHLQESSRLQMFSKYQYFVWEDGMYGITWGGFYIDNISSDPPIAFNVVSNNRIEKASFDTVMAEAFPFDLVRVNYGKCWNAITHTFTAPFDGIYFFSFSTIATVSKVNVVLQYGNISAIANYTLRERLYIKDSISLMEIGLHASSLMADYYAMNVRSISGSTILEMTTGQSAFIFRKFNEECDFTQSSFRGFFYAPPTSKFVAWTAKMTRDWNTFNQESIPFDIISVNIGGVFKNSNKSIVVIPKEGIYYITLNVNCVTPYKTALYVNKIKYFEVIAYKKDGGAFMGYERSALLKLAARDGMSLRVISTKIKNEYGKVFEQSGPVFTGFLISLSQ